MKTLLTVTHHDRIHDSYVLECGHGSSNADAETTSMGAMSGLIASMRTTHSALYGCTCANEFDLMDVYPSVDAAVEQFTGDLGSSPDDLDDSLHQGLLQKIKAARCPACSVAITVSTHDLRLVVVPLHDNGCPRAKEQRRRLRQGH